MPGKPTGQVILKQRQRGAVFALRFRAYGQRRYMTLGTRAEGWSRDRAEVELANVLADVRRGIWRPPEQVSQPVEPASEPTLHEFASQWYAQREVEGLRPRTLEYLRWALSDHLLPHFATYLLTDITAEEIDRFARWKAAEGRLSNGSINKLVQVLAAVLELAVEYGHVPTNAAKGRRRRLPTTPPARLYLEPPQVRALLCAAADLDAKDPNGRDYRRPLLATLAYAGLRIGELLALKWRDVDLASAELRVRQSKTQAGIRTIDIQPELHDDLVAYRMGSSYADASDLVFPTAAGRADNRNNVRRRVLRRAVASANERIATEKNCDPIPEDLTLHALRRSYASWLVAEGEDPAYVMQQLGHTDPKMTLGLYARALSSKSRRSDMWHDQGSAPAPSTHEVPRNRLTPRGEPAEGSTA